MTNPPKATEPTTTFKREKVPCTVCGEIGNHDWLYEVGLVGPEQYVCGFCKVEFGRMFYQFLSVTGKC